MSGSRKDLQKNRWHSQPTQPYEMVIFGSKPVSSGMVCYETSFMGSLLNNSLHRKGRAPHSNKSFEATKQKALILTEHPGNIS